MRPVVETIRNYPLVEHFLQYKTISYESIHPELFNGAGRSFKKRNYLARYIQVKSIKKLGEALRTQHEKLRTKSYLRDLLKATGINCDYPNHIDCTH